MTNARQAGRSPARLFSRAAGAAAAAAVLLIGSCASYPMPEARSPVDSGIIGTYVYDDEGEEKSELTFYEDGYFHDNMYVYEDEEWLSAVGTYFIRPGGSIIRLYYADSPDIAGSRAAARLGEDYGSLTIGRDLFRRSDDSKVPLSDDDRNRTAGVYVLSYFMDELVVIELVLDGEGRFEERSHYPESGETWVERGVYSLSFPSGVIRMEYHDWPDGAYLGFLDAAEGILYAPEGNYIRSDDSHR